MVSLLTDFNLVLAHPGQCLHRLIGVSPFGLVAWVGHILNRGGVVAVAERLLGFPGCVSASADEICWLAGLVGGAEESPGAESPGG